MGTSLSNFGTGRHSLCHTQTFDCGLGCSFQLYDVQPCCLDTHFYLFTSLDCIFPVISFSPRNGILDIRIPASFDRILIKMLIHLMHRKVNYRIRPRLQLNNSSLFRYATFSVCFFCIGQRKEYEYN